MTLIHVTQAHIDATPTYHDDMVDPVALAIGEWLRPVKPGWFVLCKANTIALCSGTSAQPTQGDIEVSAIVELEIDMNVRVGNWLATWWISTWDDDATCPGPFDFELPNDLVARLNMNDDPAEQ